ncbi:MAG: excinuclease ABC subunit UvrC [Actinomycetia bacterium]|nr:excinuclease ABC subunit UvrC [Actinomycetes bacterium]
MTHPASYRPEPGTIPVEPGVYRFWDVDGRVIYVGKAKNLRSRLSSYFVDSRNHHQRTAAMVTTAARVDWVVVANEVEALQLEYSWIKTYEPRFNVKYTDDKSYPYLAVTVGEEFPRITVLRGDKRKGVRYFGPYSHAWAIRETVDQLLRVFPARTCSKGVFRRANISGRPCLLAYIGKCSAPCVGRVTPQEHRQIIDDFCSFVGGNASKHIRTRKIEMLAAAEAEDFEAAARVRDDLFALEKAMAKNAVVFNDETDADVIALAEDELQAAVQVFHVRSGRVVGQRGFVVDRVIPVPEDELVEQALLRIYGDVTDSAVPKEVLVSQLPPARSDMADWLTSRRGSRVELRRPQRGDKKDLMATVARNAEQSLAAHKRKRIGDLTTRGQALEALQKALDLVSAPLRIEGYDISTLAGSDTVGSMVVFEDGEPRTSDYRRFTISASNAASDLASLTEVLTRRFKRYLKERTDAADFELAGSEAGGPGRRSFQYPPQLVMVDGGPAQVAAARAALDELGMDDVAVCGLAKRLEEIYLPDQRDPVVLSRASPALLLLQQVRDESHRFAIAGHRKKRSARAKGSLLDAVPGLGPAKRKTLLRHFRTTKAVQAASVAELQEVSGIGPSLAETIHTFFADGSTPSNDVVNLTTGEVIEG